MLNALGAAARVFDQRIGWNRIGIALSITVIAIAALVLYHSLHGIALKDVMKAVKARSTRDVVLAGVFVAASYCTLTFYDLFALRTIGRGNVPYRIAALSGFTSYSIGHNVGASVFTAAAVRYRIYSIWGLTAIDVAKICFVAGLTFWLGNATVLGLGIAYDPSAAGAIDQLPSYLNRLLAWVILMLLATYVIWVWREPREIGRSNWKVALPGGPLTLLQILIGIVDLGFCTLAMYALMPNQPHLAFTTIGVIFVTATLLGFASTSPGGLGVFDAAMFVGFCQFDKESLLAGLLLFRLFYYIIPFALALAIIGLREFLLDVHVLHSQNQAPPPVEEPAHFAWCRLGASRAGGDMVRLRSGWWGRVVQSVMRIPDRRRGPG
jgi:glycosyltransferase 2 family protein